MRSSSNRRLLLALAAAPLTLALAACGGGDAGPAAGDPLAKVAAPAGQKWEEVVNEGQDGGMILGNPQAPIKLVEYGSLSCPHCARFAQEAMQPLMTDFVASGRVSYEYRSFAIHPQDIPLTLLVKCAPKDAYFAMVEQVYTNFEAMNAPLGDPAVQQRAEAASKAPPATRFVAISDALGFTSFFAARGIAADQANVCLSNLDNAKAVAENAKKYGAAGISSTPTFEINGNRIEGDNSTWPKVSEALRRAGAR
ncbi:thioredoxin domain-containing protein [Novosphingobium sp.]|uniref:thioredoxin domain-containing protein n=1 Tax=Novosphingobium sp. TaxID=1874826 RepID=UPI00286C72C4|nr:thioredoxin domain-containing protein [Novosphingobium sp.]